MLNTHRILVAMGNQTFQRELVALLNKRLPSHIYDNLINYDFYNVASGKAHRHQLIKVINAEEDYKYQTLFILDDLTPQCLSAAWELLPYNEKSLSTKRNIPVKTEVFILFSSARVSRDCQKIVKIVNDKEMEYVTYNLRNEDFDRESDTILGLYEVSCINNKPELVIKLQRA